MLDIALPVLGGLGVFLLGMIIMTDALKSLAGDYMRSVMMRFTRNASTGVVTGAVTTAVLQSSSATTVAAVGFVGAGILSFTESLGIIFGANIGTTITGWLVVLVGFKLSLADVMLPIILVGAVLKLFASKKLAIIGLALAGFGLIFVGISIMQEAMSSLQQVITPAVFPDDSLSGRLQLLLLGVLITLVTQSSSAGVAMTLTALFAGAISFEQAAVLVIGMDVGTTSTAALASIGGNVSARRTGLSHVIYNLISACVAMLLLTPYISLWQSVAPGSLYNNSEIALVMFHTGFNTLGVSLVLPISGYFARFIKIVIPEKESVYIAGLDKSLLKDNGVAITALAESVKKEIRALLSHLNYLLGGVKQGYPIELQEMQIILDKTQDFADHIHIKDEKEKHRVKLLELIHALDHMQRLHERLDEDVERAHTARELASMHSLRSKLSDIISIIIDETVELEITDQSLAELDQFLAEVTEQTQQLRSMTMANIASGDLSVSVGNHHLEAFRWFQRVTIHVHKIMQHINSVL